MKIIEHLSTMIEDELNDAEKYVDCALKHKEDMPDLSMLFFNLSNEEMDHMNRLHKAVVQIIEEHRRQKGEPPPGMQAIYDYLHSKHIEHASKIKVRQTMYREN